MMKKYIILLSILLAAASCSKDRQNCKTAAIPDGAISFSAGIGKSPVNLVSEMTTSGSSFAINGAFCSSDSDFGTASPTTVFSNRQVVYGDGGWTYTPLAYWEGGRSYRFRAIWPYESTPTYSDDLNSSFSIENFTVPSTQASQVDLMVSDISKKTTTSPVTVPTAPVGLNFRHILSNIRIQINKGADDLDEFTLQSVQLFGMKDKGDYSGTSADNGASWTCSWDVSKGLSLSCNRTFSGSEGVISSTYSEIFGTDGLLLIPQAVDAVKFNINYSVTHDSHTRTKSITVNLPASPTWECGKFYIYRLTLSETYNIVFTKPIVEEWGSEQVGGIIIIQ